MVWIKFLICAVVIFFAGKRVAKYADAISEKTALSGLWVGFILVSIATSLPELFTGVGSVMIDAPNLTMGNIFGANTYNLMNIGILDILHRGGPILGAVSSGQLLTAVFNIFIAGLAVLGIWLAGSRFFEASVFGVGVFSVAIFACYVISARMIFNFERRACLPARQEFPRKKETRLPAGEAGIPANLQKYNHISIAKTWVCFCAAAAVIIASGIWLAYIGDELAGTLDLDRHFVGSFFIGLATTLPEITVSVSALLLGAKEIAIANMLGSNLFNVAIIFVNDVLYRKGPILHFVSQNHILSGIFVLIMTGIVTLGIIGKPKKKIFFFGWYTPLLVMFFLLSFYLGRRM